MPLIAQGFGEWMEVFLGLLFLGFLAMVVFLVMKFLVKAADSLTKKNRDVPSDPGQYLRPDNALPISNGRSSDGGRPQRGVHKALEVAVCALVGAILGGVLIWPIGIFCSFGAFLFAKPHEVLLVTAISAFVGALSGAVVGVAHGAFWTPISTRCVCQKDTTAKPRHG